MQYIATVDETGRTYRAKSADWDILAVDSAPGSPDRTGVIVLGPGVILVHPMRSGDHARRVAARIAARVERA